MVGKEEATLSLLLVLLLLMVQELMHTSAIFQSASPFPVSCTKCIPYPINLQNIVCLFPQRWTLLLVLLLLLLLIVFVASIQLLLCVVYPYFYLYGYVFPIVIVDTLICENPPNAFSY